MGGEGMEVAGLPFEAASRDPSVDARHLLRTNGSLADYQLNFLGGRVLSSQETSGSHTEGAGA